MFGQLALMIFPVAMAFAAANDLFTMRIPNKISLVLIGGFVAAAVAARLPIETIAIHIGIAAAVLVATFTLFNFNFLGGGDAKLMAAGALWMGADQAAPFLLFTTLFGGALSMAILSYRRLVPVVGTLPGWAQRLHVKNSGIPYGIAVAAAALKVYPATEIFRALVA